MPGITIDGTPGDDVIVATPLGDNINGFGGDDIVYTLGGGDLVEAGEGNDRIVDPSTTRSILFGNTGNDTFVVYNSAPFVREFEGEGFDRVFAVGTSLNAFVEIERVVLQGDVGDQADGSRILNLNDYANSVEGSSGVDKIFAFGGDDSILANGGNDIVDAGAGNDNVRGGEGNDTLLGGEGEDRLLGEAGEDDVNGGSGNDRLFGDAGDDELDGAAGDDMLFGGAGDDVLIGDGGSTKNNPVTGNDFLYGGDGNDELEGGRGNDVLDGGAGDDVLRGDASDNLLVSRGDRFVFVGEWGDDTVLDFRAGIDKLDLRGNGLAAADLLLEARDLDEDGVADDLFVSVAVDGFGTIALLNLTEAQFLASDVLL